MYDTHIMAKTVMQEMLLYLTVMQILQLFTFPTVETINQHVAFRIIDWFGLEETIKIF